MAETEKKRVKWGSQVEFILTLVGFAVGLGNVWRFPFLCYKNGGGAFLIPYFICLVVMGVPLFFLELCFGQFSSLGPIKVWIINPAMKGVGYASVIVCGLIAIYYNVIIAVCVHFFFGSMTSTLPWTECNPDWASCDCRDSTMNTSESNPWNNTRPECANTNTDNPTSPSEEYFNNRVLKITSGLDVTGSISWELVLCLLLCWIIVFLVLTKGIKSLGKVVYVTAVFPYILLTALLIRGLTLDGHAEGIHYYLTPNMTKLTEASVWSDAAVQIFYSLSACQGGLIAMASYNQFHNNILRDALLVPLINCGTSFYAGFVIFSSLGFMAAQKNVTVAEVATGGPGLAFVAYPEALAQMPIAPLWAILFFLMMMMLGFSSEFSLVETVLTGLIDEFKFKSKSRIILFRAGACLLGFLLGLPMVTGCGFHLLDLVDNATGGFPLLFVGFFEILGIVYVYGISRFRHDIEMMLGKSTFTVASFFYFIPMWMAITPLCLLGVIGFKAYQYKAKHESDPEVFPAWADALWWGVVLLPILFIPVWYIAYSCRFSDINKPKPSWGPAQQEHRTGRYGNQFVEPPNKEFGSTTNQQDNMGYTPDNMELEKNGKVEKFDGLVSGDATETSNNGWQNDNI